MKRGPCFLHIGVWLLCMETSACLCLGGEPEAKPSGERKPSDLSRLRDARLNEQEGKPVSERTRAEVEALIEKAGTTPPDWWDSVTLDYPPTLDLAWTNAPNQRGTNQNLNLYIWNVINVNPPRWKQGAKLLFHTLSVNKNDPGKLKQSMNALAKIYHDLLQDYARAAYWWRKAGSTGCGNCPLGLADCYHRLGNKEMAVEVLQRFNQPLSMQAIRTWAEVGEHDKALQMALDMTNKNAGPLKSLGFLIAGDVCRIAARYNEALGYYQKALEGGNMPRARTALEAVKCFDALDLKKVPDGNYKDGSQGYSSIVQVAVTVKAHVIEDVKIVDHHEKQYYGSLIETPERIIQKQGVKGVDVFSSATLTSEAIIQASAKALANASK